MQTLAVAAVSSSAHRWAIVALKRAISRSLRRHRRFIAGPPVPTKAFRNRFVSLNLLLNFELFTSAVSRKDSRSGEGEGRAGVTDMKTQAPAGVHTYTKPLYFHIYVYCGTHRKSLHGDRNHVRTCSPPADWWYRRLQAFNESRRIIVNVGRFFCESPLVCWDTCIVYLRF